MLLNFWVCGKSYIMKILNPSNSRGLKNTTLYTMFFILHGGDKTNGYKYFSNAFIYARAGGCGQDMCSDTWVQVLRGEIENELCEET
jgi:cAMP phosphodiesterase